MQNTYYIVYILVMLHSDIPNTLLHLTVVDLLHHEMDLWRATLAQQRVQRCSTAVTQVWFQREGWELFALEMLGWSPNPAELSCTVGMYTLVSA